MSIARTIKVCEICGDEYEGIPTQKYCPICGKKPDRARKRCEKAQNLLNIHMGIYDEPKKKKCQYCGKEFSTYNGFSFCSEECRKRHRIENATCTFCGRNLLSLGIEHFSKTGGTRFCSEECRNKWKERVSLYNNVPSNLQTCPQCGKDFKGKNTIFCSKDCYEKAKSEGWKPDKYKKVEVLCGHCKKAFTTSYKSPSRYCPECTTLLWKNRKKKADIAKKKQAEEKRQADIEKNGLCFYCQTTYSNCEKMRTNFRYYPKGAKLKQGKVIECPSYTDKNISKKK